MNYMESCRGVFDRLGQSENAALALAALDPPVTGSAQGFAALRAHGVEFGTPYDDDVLVYQHVSFTYNMKRGRKYPRFSDTVFFFDGERVRYCNVTRIRNRARRVTDDPHQARHILDCNIEYSRGGEEK